MLLASMTTVPAVAQSTPFIPQLVAGGGWKTVVLIHNPDPDPGSPITLQAEFYDQHRKPLPTPLVGLRLAIE
jgi:hypothetical protein